MKYNCPNCGAPVYIDRRWCPYCDTPYTIGLISDIRNDPDLETIRWAFRDGLITANEAREYLGLARSKETERLYDEALEAMRKYSGVESILYADDKPIAYSVPYYGVDGNLRLERIR